MTLPGQSIILDSQIVGNLIINGDGTVDSTSVTTGGINIGSNGSVENTTVSEGSITVNGSGIIQDLSDYRRWYIHRFRLCADQHNK